MKIINVRKRTYIDDFYSNKKKFVQEYAKITYIIIYKDECFTRSYKEGWRGLNVRWEYKPFGGGAEWIGSEDDKELMTNDSFTRKHFQYHMLEKEFQEALIQYTREQKIKRILNG